jgi:TM2 domain-containing membrane protein YozV
MQRNISTKYRLVTLLLILILPGSHRIYVGKLKSGFGLLAISIFLSANHFIDFLGLKQIQQLQQPQTSTVLPLLALLLVSLVYFVIFIVDFYKISVGKFTDSNNCTLLRRRNYAISKKSNFIAITLCTVLGFAGAHRFYLKKYISASIILVNCIILLAINHFLAEDFVYNFAFIIEKYYLQKLPFNYILKTMSTLDIVGTIYCLLFIIWVYVIDLIALLGGVLTDNNRQLPRDYSS